MTHFDGTSDLVLILELLKLLVFYIVNSGKKYIIIAS